MARGGRRLRPLVVARSPDRATWLTEGLHEQWETFGRVEWHGQETVPQRATPQAAKTGALRIDVARLRPDLLLVRFDLHLDGRQLVAAAHFELDRLAGAV